MPYLIIFFRCIIYTTIWKIEIPSWWLELEVYFFTLCLLSVITDSIYTYFYKMNKVRVYDKIEYGQIWIYILLIFPTGLSYWCQ